MSLVIAKIIGGRVRIESDSQSSSTDATQQYLLDTVLKSIIVTPDIVVCFAGSVKLAHEAVSEIYSTLVDAPNTPADELSAILLRKHLPHIREVDFILAVSDLTNPQLYKISTGNITREQHSAWIGDTDGFSLFQTIYNKNQPAQQDFDALHMHFNDAFKGVIKSRSIPSVGGFQITVASHKDNRLFKYLFAGGRTTPRQYVPYGGVHKLEFDNEKQDGYAFSILTSGESDTPAVGIYVAQLKLGLLYIPSHSMNVIRRENLSGLNFVDEVLKNFDIRLCGTVFDVRNNEFIPLNIDSLERRYKITNYVEDLSSGEERVLTHEFIMGKQKRPGVFRKMWNLLLREF